MGSTLTAALGLASLTANGTPDAALRIFADPSLVLCAPPTAPTSIATLRILADRLYRWLPAAFRVPAAPDVDLRIHPNCLPYGMPAHLPASPTPEYTANFDEIRLGVFRFVDAVLQFDVTDPVVVLSAARLVARLHETEQGKEALEKVVRHAEMCAPQWEREARDGRLVLKAGPAEWAIRKLNQLPEGLLLRPPPPRSPFQSSSGHLLIHTSSIFAPPAAFPLAGLGCSFRQRLRRVPPHSPPPVPRPSCRPRPLGPATPSSAPSTSPSSNSLSPLSDKALDQMLVDGLHEVVIHAR